jgi:SAM-dependent methyltransferase
MTQQILEGQRAVVSAPYERRRLRLMANEVCGRRVLDIGYANQPSPHLTGDEVVGLDLTRVDPERAPNYTERIVGDATDLSTSIGDRTFDTILCGELIEHLQDPYRFLAQMRDHVEAHGRLVLSTPNPTGLPVLLAEWLSSRRFYAEDHLYLFSPRWVARMLERSGLRLISTRGVGIWLPRGCLPAPAALSYIVIYVATPA